VRRREMLEVLPHPFRPPRLPDINTPPRPSPSLLRSTPPPTQVTSQGKKKKTRQVSDLWIRSAAFGAGLVLVWSRFGAVGSAIGVAFKCEEI